MPEIVLEQGSPDWLEWRKTRVTATDTAKVLRGDQWALAPSEVWLRKQQLEPANPKMIFGSVIEPFARDYAAKTLSMDFQPTCWAHSDHDWLVASLDGIAFKEDGARLLEVKAGAGDRRTLERTGEPSLYVYMQIQHQLLVTGLPKAILVSFPCLPSASPEREEASALVRKAGGELPDSGYAPRILEVTADVAAQRRVLATALAIWGCRPPGVG